MTSSKICITGTRKGLGKAIKDYFGDNPHPKYSGDWCYEGYDLKSSSLQDIASECSVLINNAFYFKEQANLWQVTEDFDKILRKNLETQTQLLTTFYGEFMARGGGTIITINSLACLHPNPKEPLYGAAKMAQLGLTRSFQMHSEYTGVRFINLLIGKMENHGGKIKFLEVAKFIHSLLDQEWNSCYPSEIVLRA